MTPLNGAEFDAFAPATTMLTALRQRDIGSAELVELHLSRINHHNPTLNAIVVPAEDPAAAARSADAARARGEVGMLLGLPITLKESMNVRGLPTTVGVPDFVSYRASEDGAVAARTRSEGAVLLGKTNIPPLLADWQSANPIYGQTVNPWDPRLTPGGSTGGGAAALAAGLSPLEFGSDIGGSIRLPAAFCGVYGHKSSETALPRSGQFPEPVLPNAAAVMGVQGPLARSADDLALGLAVAAGPELGEDMAWRLVLPPPRAKRLRDLRVAVLPHVAWLPLSADVQQALTTVVRCLERAGATVGMAQPESLGDVRDHHALYVSLMAAVTATRLGAEERERRARLQESRGDEFSAARACGLRASVADWFGWHARRERYRAAYRAFFRDWDVLLAPIVLRTAFPHHPTSWPRSEAEMTATLDVDGECIAYDLQSVYPGLATLSGQPATAFPAGLSPSGLPIGLQAIGPYLEDHTPIFFAGLLADEIGGFHRPPGYH
ncbi:MAG: amidase family protein [Chloroflexota bacterium]|nr:amidase family protein [Chloroflexota bacterium]